MPDKSNNLSKYNIDEPSARPTVILGFFQRKKINKTVFAALEILNARAMPAPGAKTPCHRKYLTKINANIIFTTKEKTPAKVGDFESLWA